MMDPSAQDNSKVANSGVTSDRGASIHGFSRAWDLTMCCKPSGTGNFMRTLCHTAHNFSLDDIQNSLLIPFIQSYWPDTSALSTGSAE